jgi:hypothetical protein
MKGMLMWQGVYIVRKFLLQMVEGFGEEQSMLGSRGEAQKSETKRLVWR